jgi:hypothetical protein
MNQRGGVFGMFKSKEDQLMDALKNKDFSKATEFVNKGADVNKLLPNGYSVLFEAIRSQSPNALNFIKLILDKGANVNIGAFETSPLIFAVQQYDLNTEFFSEVIKILCSKGVNKTAAIDKVIKEGKGIELEVLLTNNCGAPDSAHPPLTSANIARRTTEYAANSAKKQQEWNADRQRKKNIFAATPSYNRYKGGSRRKLKKRVTRNKKTIKRRKA